MRHTFPKQSFVQQFRTSNIVAFVRSQRSGMIALNYSICVKNGILGAISSGRADVLSGCMVPWPCGADITCLVMTQKGPFLLSVETHSMHFQSSCEEQLETSTLMLIVVWWSKSYRARSPPLWRCFRRKLCNTFQYGEEPCVRKYVVHKYHETCTASQDFTVFRSVGFKRLVAVPTSLSYDESTRRCIFSEENAIDTFIHV